MAKTRNLFTWRGHEDLLPRKKARIKEPEEGGVNMDVDEEEQRKAPENRREPDGQEVFHYNGREYNEFRVLRMLKILCRELNVSQHGSKKDLLKRLSRKVRENEAIETLACLMLSHLRYQRMKGPVMRKLPTTTLLICHTSHGVLFVLRVKEEKSHARSLLRLVRNRVLDPLLPWTIALLRLVYLRNPQLFVLLPLTHGAG